jgi:cytochrome c nitrite reductase small subunit
MESKSVMTYVSIVSVVAAVGMFGYLVHASKMMTYLTEDPKVCINCHTMNTQYATWQHSSHREEATCVECHLPQEPFFDKIAAKVRDGFMHSKAMTFHTYVSHTIGASESAQKRIQANCIACHREMVSQMVATSKLYQAGAESGQVDRKCWSCHRNVPHGRARGLNATPDNLGVKEI